MSRPFDKTRNGFVLGEGSGAMMLEDLEYAKARGAKIYAEVVGYGSAADAWDLIQPVEKGDGTRRAMIQALERHGVPADEIDLINPHGTSTPLGDLREAQAIWAVFGDHTPEIAISATKSMTGHLMGAAGAVEGVFTVLSVYNQCAPGTAQLPRRRPGDQPQRRQRRVALDGDPLRDERQHRPGRPQRRGHLQALRRRLTHLDSANALTTESPSRTSTRSGGASTTSGWSFSDATTGRCCARACARAGCLTSSSTSRASTATAAPTGT